MKYEDDWESSVGSNLLHERTQKFKLTRNQVADNLSNVLINRIPDARTVSNHENGHGKMSVDTLLAYCNIYDCEIGYLFGDYDCHSKEVQEIRDLTGLEEKSIDTLKMIKKKSPHSKEEDDLFFSFLTKVIIDYYNGEPEDIFYKITYGGRPTTGEFPIMKLISYIQKVRQVKDIENSEHYSEIMKIRADAVSDKGNEPSPISLRERISELGYDAVEEYEKMRRCEAFNNRDKRNDRFDIQEAITRFLDSDFVEGK